MPNWFPSWTKCCDPADYRAQVLPGGIRGPLGPMIASSIVGLIMGVLASFVAISAGVALFLASLCIAAIAFCSWWLDVRLICLGGDRSAIGAIYHLEPPVPTANPFDVTDADTDFSFNLLLWQFVPRNALPDSFVSNQWSPNAIPQLAADWPTLPPLVPSVPFAQVAQGVNLILPQQSMASLGLGFGGQNIESTDQPNPPLAGGTNQHFLLHCEIEGPGMHDLLILLDVLLAVFIAAAFVFAIPVVGPILSWILIALALLAFLIGVPAITNDDASPPSGGGWGGSFNPYDTAGGPNDLVDIAYVYGRWVYDSFHVGSESNELHPLHYMIKMGKATQGDLAAGNWPPDMGDTQLKYDAQFTVINSPSTVQIQSQPENRWTVHPLLDGCRGSSAYPEPPPPGSVII